MHSAATQSALHFHVTQILIENPRQHLTTQPVGNIQHRFLSRHFAPTRHIVPFAVLGWDILILLKKIACHRETNPPLSPPFWRYAYACAMVFMTRILSFERIIPESLVTRPAGQGERRLWERDCRSLRIFRVCAGVVTRKKPFYVIIL